MPVFDNVAVDLSPLWSIFFCTVIGSSFVLSLYVGTDRKLNRDDPKTVTNRFARVTFICLFSIFLFSCCCSKSENGKTVLQLLGFTSSGLLSALIIPLLHTVIYHIGKTVLGIISGYEAILLCLQSYYTFQPLIHLLLNHWRGIVFESRHMGPISEEIVYRACMLPTLIPNFGEGTSIVLSPLFFGLAHFHHVYASIKEGVSVKTAAIKACFQFTYTTLFGMYSAFLFVRTENIMPCMLTHMFCNHMGFPNFMEVLAWRDQHIKSKVIKAYIFGLISFIVLLVPLTAPSLYNATTNDNN